MQWKVTEVHGIEPGLWKGKGTWHLKLPGVESMKMVKKLVIREESRADV